MHEKEVQQEIRWWIDPNGGNLKQDQLMASDFLDDPKRTKLRKKFHQTEYHHRHMKWPELVLFVLEPQQRGRRMYDRLLSLILKHRRDDECFELITKDGFYPLPNPLAELERFEALYKEYFGVYERIRDQILLECSEYEHAGVVQEKNKKLKNFTAQSVQKSPSNPVQKEITTSENILLILCLRWLHTESSRLLQLKFKRPLMDSKKALLCGIAKKTKTLLDEFPFSGILEASKTFWHLQNSDPQITNLEEKTRQRIKNQVIENPDYNKLLQWITEFRRFGISKVTQKNPTQYMLDSVENIDTVYEAWVFAEFAEFVHQKGLLTDFRLGQEPHFQFEYGGKKIIFWYEKTFSVSSGHAWIIEHTPDFSVMCDGEILAVFDAKNYAKASSGYSDSQNKILSYLNNLDVNFGALIYSNHPKNWDDLTTDEKIQSIRKFFNSRFPEKSDAEVKKTMKDLVGLFWDQLPAEYKEISPPVAFKKFQYPHPGKKARFHFGQTFCIFRIPLEQTEQAVKIKDESLNEIFKEITSRVS
jgi:hypothetical protein